MTTINMLSSAEKVKGQGVASAYIEQVNLVKNGLSDKYKVEINKFKFSDITHYHTVDLKHFLSLPFTKVSGTTVGYVHFLPETVEESLDMPVLFKKAFYKYMIAFYNQMDYLVTVNPYFIDKLCEYGIDRDKVTYIPNFVSSKDFYPYDANKKKEVRKKYGIDPEAFVVLGVGQVQTRKGVLDFVKIAKNMPDVQFIWAGGFSFGKITSGYKELKDIVDSPPENVKFIGIVERDDMNSVYNMSDVFFLPSYNELFPMSILEAMNCHVPIVLRDIDIYKNILFGYYLKAKDNKGFEEILYNLKNDENFYKTARKKSIGGSSYYSKEHVLYLWREFYDSISKDLKTKRFWGRKYEKESN
ncbi:glycosyltransferase family 4 protein [Proteiniborus sp. MB09-C3]|uniref:glycosyltransferase family 4 protein n=1 Tax=Proteiniborus sp. MB09-C3 TaxID=3050072 RepID=UPI0025541D57|nr:glycosyltransferase family 4 protein [Proteiniborus sp. MB09-C3]WIV12998.1 glycosyltransferase family 4 protein [Proteiniborus sp. MB09-C3]